VLTDARQATAKRRGGDAPQYDKPKGGSKPK
jgi:hypothetical protein